MAAFTPPGWPAVVPPPGSPDWEQAAAEWLIDLCPPDFRGYPVLRRHPSALAWLAGSTWRRPGRRWPGHSAGPGPTWSAS